MDANREEVIEQLVNLEWPREQCIEALLKTADSHDINDVLATLNSMQYNHFDTIHDQSKYHHASHNILMVFGYLRELYEDKYNLLIPSDIKLLCCDYCGYSLCCIAFTKRQHDEELCGNFEVEEASDFFTSNHLIYRLHEKKQNINTIEALFSSIIAQHMTCFNYLFPQTIQPSLNSCSPLYVAARVGNIDCVQQLIENPSTLMDEPNGHGRTPLFIASFFGYYDIINLLINTSKQININHSDSKGFFPLFCAAQNGFANVVQILLQNNAEVNQVEKRLHSALWIASLRGQLEVVKILLTHKDIIIDQPDLAGVTPVCAACQNNQHEVVELLLNPPNNKKGADPNLPKNDGCQPLWVAAHQNSAESMKILIKYGADCNKGDKIRQATPLFVASQNGSLNAVQVLLSTDGIDVNKARFDDKTTPLMMAAHNGHYQIVKLLLEHDADFEKRNCRELNVFACAAMQGQKKCFQLLYGHVLKEINDEKHIEGLIDNADSIYGCTPFHLACMNGHEEMVKYLINTIKIDIHKKDFDGLDGMQHALNQGHQDLAKWLSSQQ